MKSSVLDSSAVSTSFKKNYDKWIVLAAFAVAGCFCLAPEKPFLFHLFGADRQSAIPTTCLSNMKQLALNGIMYANDNNGHLQDASVWMDGIQAGGYTKSAWIFSCPVVKIGHGYSMNSNLSRALDQKVPHPDSAILLFESNDLAWNAHGPVASMAFPARHREKDNVAFVDGHVTPEIPGHLKF